MENVNNANMAILHKALILEKPPVPAATFSAPSGEKREEGREMRGEKSERRASESQR